MNADDRLQVVIAHIKLGDLLGNPNLPNLGRTEAAMAQYDHALATIRPLLASTPEDPRVRRYVGLTHERIGSIHQQASRWPEAGAAYRESFVIREALAAAAPVHVEIQRDLAIADEKLANVEQRSGQLEAAVGHARGALARFQRLADLDTANANAARRRPVTPRASPTSWGALTSAGRTTPGACLLWREAAALRRRPAAAGCGVTTETAPAIEARLSRCGGAPTGAH